MGDESDLDCDSLAVSVSAPLAAARNVGSGSATEIPSNNSAQTTTTTVAIHRPPLIRRESHVRGQVGTTSTSETKPSTVNARQWTLSSALTDEGISDEGLIKELERVREILEWDCTPMDMDGHDTSFFSSPSSSHRSPSWLKTQRALMTTRELILTERHYLSSLLLLLCSDSTLTPVPEMMVPYVKELVGVSERLLKGMEGEPSVRGVSEVFVEVGGGVVDGDKGAESAFVGWCRVVGGWFQDDLAVSGDTQAVVEVKRKRTRFDSGPAETRLISEHEGSNSGFASSPTSTTTTPSKRNASTWRRRTLSIGRDRDKDEGDSPDRHGHRHRGRMSPTSFTPGTSSAISMTSTRNSKPIRKPAVRDLAILPTQRVMRYVLLYRDLLANTPTSSSSYPMVERALEAACRIAEKCDRAQGNAAFSTSRSPAVERTGAILPEQLKIVWGSSTASTISSSYTKSITGSPTKSHFFSSSSLSTSSSQASSKLPSTSLPLQASPTTNRLATNPLPPSPPPPPPSSFHSKIIPIARSGRSLGSLSTSSAGSSTVTTLSSSSSSSPLSSSSSLYASSTLFLPKSTSSSSPSGSFRKPRALSAVSLMSHL